MAYDSVSVLIERNILEAERNKLLAAITEHHAQKADDRCVEDDDKLYAAAGLPPCDRRVGDKAAMLKNCERFINNRCEAGGPWKSYSELEAELQKVRQDAAAHSSSQCKNMEASCDLVHASEDLGTYARNLTKLVRNLLNNIADRNKIFRVEQFNDPGLRDLGRVVFQDGDVQR